MNTLHPRLRRSLASLCLALGTTLGAVAAETVTLYRTTTYQQIWGFGAAANHPVKDLRTGFSYATQQEILDRLFRTDGSNAGLSIVRLEINCYTKAQDADQSTFMPAPGLEDWDSDQHQRWFALEAKTRGMTQFYAVPWSPPAWMKVKTTTAGDPGYMVTTTSPNQAGELSPLHYDNFADYMAKYVKQYRDVFGIPIKWISVQNEPNVVNFTYATCKYWTAAMNTVAEKVADKVHAQFPSVKVGAPETMTRGSSVNYINAMTASTRAKLDFVPVHDYLEYVPVPGFGKPVFNAEVCDGVDPATGNPYVNVNTIDNALKWGNAVAQTLKDGHPGWMYWWSVTPNNDPSSQGLINLKKTETSPGSGVYNYTYLANKRLYALGQFARYLRPNYTRCLAASSSTNLVSVAGLNANGKAVVIVINNGTSAVTTDIVGIGSTAVSAHRTSATEDLAPLTSVNPAGGKITVTLPAKSITSFRES